MSHQVSYRKSDGGIFSIKVLSFKITLGCVIDNNTNYHTRLPAPCLHVYVYIWILPEQVLRQGLERVKFGGDLRKTGGEMER